MQKAHDYFSYSHRTANTAMDPSGFYLLRGQGGAEFR